MINLPTIVAHRGLSALYPENTAIAIEQAIQAGAKAVEFDVQLTSDQVPVLFHDFHLQRLTGTKGTITESTWQQVQQLRMSYPERFNRQFENEPVISLQQALSLFAEYPQVVPCLEIKEESIDAHGLDKVISTIVLATGAMTDRILFLSFSYDALDMLQRQGLRNTVWVLREYDQAHRERAGILGPAVLAVNINKLPQGDDVFWPGPWQWMVYQTEDAEVVRRFTRLGAKYIETDNIRLIADTLPEYF